MGEETQSGLNPVTHFFLADLCSCLALSCSGANIVVNVGYRLWLHRRRQSNVVRSVSHMPIVGSFTFDHRRQLPLKR